MMVIPGCVGEFGAITALVFGVTLSMWWLGLERQRRRSLEAQALRRALASGRHRGVERHLRRQLALSAAAGEGGGDRVGLLRAQLAELLIAEWRLDEAQALYDAEDSSLSEHLRILIAFGRHELAILCEPVDDARLDAIRRDRDACLAIVPGPIQGVVARAWGALEGVALIRGGRPREGLGLLEGGIDAVTYNPAQIVYLFHLAQAYERVGERERAIARYWGAIHAFPGTRLASEAQSRLHALGGRGAGFRGMLPEAPARTRSP